MAGKSGGCYYNLQASRNDKTIVASVGKSSFGFISADFGEDEIGETYPDQPQPIIGTEGQSYLLASPSSFLSVHLHTNRKERKIRVARQTLC